MVKRVAMPKLYRTPSGPIVEQDHSFYAIESCWDELINQDDVLSYISRRVSAGTKRHDFSPTSTKLLPPIQSQEIWAAGVTYYRSRDARMEESKDAGGGSFYDRVYSAARPELFYKGSAHRTVAPGAAVRIRADAKWNVPEPELTLVINSRGKIVGYTIGNDMSSRDIEGENPLYLPQAKVYDGSAALGPAILIAEDPLPPTTPISLQITRNNLEIFSGNTTLASLKRTPSELVHYLFRENTFPQGVFLMTGTGIIPPTTFTLQPNDQIEIRIDPIGTLINTVEQHAPPPSKSA